MMGDDGALIKTIYDDTIAFSDVKNTFFPIVYASREYTFGAGEDPCQG